MITASYWLTYRRYDKTDFRFEISDVEFLPKVESGIAIESN